MTSESGRPLPFILIAEDDDDYFFIMQEAIAHLGDVRIGRVRDGEELMDSLGRIRAAAKKGEDASALPALIFMDINMPRMNGLEALEKIKADPSLRPVPVVMLSISKNPQDVAKSYALGAVSFIRKPFDFSQLVEVFRVCGRYWFGIVQLP